MGLGDDFFFLTPKANVTKAKMTAFVVSAFFAGVAGVLYSHNLKTLVATKFDYNINLFHVQPYTCFEIGLAQINNTENLKGRYNIGYWLEKNMNSWVIGLVFKSHFNH